MPRKSSTLVALVATCLLIPAVAKAHFIWLVHDAGPAHLHLYFGEMAEADDPDLLTHVATAEVYRLDRSGNPQRISLNLEEDSLVGHLNKTSEPACYWAKHSFGVMTRGESTFLLRYYAKTGPALGDPAWKQIDTSRQLALDLVPERVGDDVVVTALWNGKGIEGAQVVVAGPGLTDFEGLSDKQGQVKFAGEKPGLYSIRVRHIEPGSGEVEGKAYTSTRHYSTLALRVERPAKDPNASAGQAFTYPNLPAGVTSFGAAIAKGTLFVYGGHLGRAHEYYQEAQGKTLYQLRLGDNASWKSIASGPGLQGLAMVAHQNKLYRIGGFTARNSDGEEHDLWSQAEVRCFDLTAGDWTDAPALPQPRSSFDAAVLDHTVYVVGGWNMAGETKTWHRTAVSLDLANPQAEWVELPAPPFQRRALAVAAFAGKVYAIGGMQQEGGPTTRVDIYDPSTKTWSQGPDLQGERMDGFGASAFATGGNLYCTTYSGKLQRLSKDGKSWQVLKELERARFFHRMLPVSDDQLISVGGASMTEGKFEQLDLIDLRGLKSTVAIQETEGQ